MNRVFLIGNLTRDPELTETASGVSVCHFTIAVTRSYTAGDGERETDFFNCTAWRGLADSIARFCKKGGKVAVSGSVQLRNYDDNKGQKRTTVDIIVQEAEFLSRKTSEEDDDLSARRERIGNSLDSYENRRDGAKKPVQQRISAFDDDDDIPF